MNTSFYKLRQGKMISGVLAGMADKYNIDVSILRILFVVFTFITGGSLGIILYIAAAIILPYKDTPTTNYRYQSGNRRRKDADVINNDDDDDWVW